MKRRDFIKRSAVAAGVAGTFNFLPPLRAADSDSPTPVEPAGTPADNRSADYLAHGRAERFLPQPPGAPQKYPVSPMPLAERLRRKIVPRRGFCSLAPGNLVSESLITGNGAMNLEISGDPYAEQILFHHESLLLPWHRPLEAPKVADLFPQIREMVLAGRHSEAMTMAAQRMNEGPVKFNTEPHLTVPAFFMQLDLPKTASVKNYLRTVNFENSEIQVAWTDDHGDWLRQTFVSRPDNLVVQRLAAPAGQSVNVRLSLQKSAAWTMNNGMTWGNRPARGTPKGIEAGEVRQNNSEQRLIYQCRLDPSVDNSGYAGVTRVVLNGGSARLDQETLVIENAASVLLLTRIEYFPDYSEANVDALRQAMDGIATDYSSLLERHRAIQSELLNRVTVDFGGDAQYGLSVEELLSDQRSRRDFSPALLEQIFGMGRYWFILNSGKYPSIAAEVNSTINLQTAGAVQGGMREGLEAYFNWMESLALDCRANAQNIFGFRGASYPLFPDKGVGVSHYYTSASATKAGPYWISAGGGCVRPFWDHYLATGDQDFLRNRVIPAYKDLALFYEDFLTATDKNGRYIFAPSISPENTPVSTDPVGSALVNATMDIAVCREVLVNLIQACQTLNLETEGVAKWQAMLAKLPPYLVELDGTLKEWAWPAVQEHYSHRHVSHLYGVWPGDDIDPDRTPQLARAALIAGRRRTFDTMTTAVSGEVLPAYARCHRALAGARLKDNLLVDTQLRQLLEQGYVSTALRCSRDPYAGPVPDAQAGFPAILMEMLAYSRPGVIEVLPALPPSLVKGSIHGLLARTFARIDHLVWDMQARTVDLTVTSLRNQGITLIARHGIVAVTASTGVLVAKPEPGQANCELRLPAGTPVEIHLQLGPHNPLDWAAGVA